MHATADTAPPLGPPPQGCRPEEASAYLDGELSAEAAAAFEAHARACPSCHGALNEQRRLLCLLEAAFGESLRREPALPRDFSRVVRARAESDMGRVRAEKKRALLLCAALALVAFALLGGAAFASVLAPVRFVARALASAIDIAAHTTVETGRGAALVMRAAGTQFTGAPGAARVFALLGLTGAIVLLLRLISSYHRTRIPD
jgi:anti-sigma factor RsiW